MEGCLGLIKAREQKFNFSYDWILRTRVDGFWAAPLEQDNFVRGVYVVPQGSRYGGLNDRFGLGDSKTSAIALSRLSLIPILDKKGYRKLNSESAFMAQLQTSGILHEEKRLPFCVLSERRYAYPPQGYGIPVVDVGSRGPLSGAKCRPCRAKCTGICVAGVMGLLESRWSWTEWRNGSLKLCDASGKWENGWEELFDAVAGKEAAVVRRRIGSLKMDDCVEGLRELRRRSLRWEAPSLEEICRAGLTGQEILHVLHEKTNASSQVKP